MIVERLKLQEFRAAYRVCLTVRSSEFEIPRSSCFFPPAQEVVDDYTFECEAGSQAQRTKVSIIQSLGDPLVYGKIYCTKDGKADEDGADLKLTHPP